MLAVLTKAQQGRNLMATTTTEPIVKRYEVRTESRSAVRSSIPYETEEEARSAYRNTVKPIGLFVSLLVVLVNGSIISIAHK